LGVPSFVLIQGWDEQADRLGLELAVEVETVLHLLLGIGLLAQLQLVELRFQHREGFRAVAVLRAVVLALGNGAGGQVGDAHRRIGGVHVLAARAAGAHRVDADVGAGDLDVDLLCLWQDGDGRGRGVDAA
jgi:hypothetical protein